jgi:hypothetical protein
MVFKFSALVGPLTRISGLGNVKTKRHLCSSSTNARTNALMRRRRRRRPRIHSMALFLFYCCCRRFRGNLHRQKLSKIAPYLNRYPQSPPLPPTHRQCSSSPPTFYDPPAQQVTLHHRTTLLLRVQFYAGHAYINVFIIYHPFQHTQQAHPTLSQKSVLPPPPPHIHTPSPVPHQYTIHMNLSSKSNRHFQFEFMSLLTLFLLNLHQQVSSVHFHPGGDKLATAAGNKVSVLNTQPPHTLTPIKHNRSIYGQSSTFSSPIKYPRLRLP